MLIEKNNSIDLLEMFGLLWSRKKIIIITVFIGTVCGLLFSLTLPDKYEASSIFIPQLSAGNGPGKLGGLAAIAGIDLKMNDDASVISPKLYPKIVSSIPFHLVLLNSSIVLDSIKFTFAEYLDEQNLLLPHEISDTLESGSENTVLLADNLYNLIGVSKQKVFIDTHRDGYVKLTATDENPMIAAQIANIATKELQRRVIEHKISNTRVLYSFIENLWSEKQKQFYAVEDSLAYFNERNQNIVSSIAQNQQRRLESRYDVLNSVYTDLWRQKEQIAIKLKKDTPIFTIIDPVVVPNHKSAPKPVMIMVLFGALSGTIIIVFILLKAYVFTKLDS